MDVALGLPPLQARHGAPGCAALGEASRVRGWAALSDEGGALAGGRRLLALTHHPFPCRLEFRDQAAQPKQDGLPIVTLRCHSHGVDGLVHMARGKGAG